eukprot:tig00001371_g8428.t1
MHGAPLAYGVDYYPEQWPRERWPIDAREMREAGLGVVRLAEFSWALLEPKEGVFEWQWLDDAIRVLAEEGLQICMCTPTPTPPAWLTAKYPLCLRVDNTKFARMHPQTRRHVCANDPDYGRLAERISERVAERYGRHGAVVAWQLDNEFGCHDTVRCVCDHCARAFRAWLQERHGTLEALNAAWGTAFWSQCYNDWAEILPPRPAPADQNPGLMLDFARFSSDTWVRFGARMAAAVRRHSDRPVTHNGMIHYTHYDQFALAAPLDFFSWDNYRHPGASPLSVAANHAFIWGAKQGNFWVVEQQAGQVNWSRHNPLLPDGALSLAAVQALAHGADGLLFFRWRQARHGAEMYHSGLLDFAGRPTRALEEVRALGRQWPALAAALRGTRPATEAIAVLFDYDGHWALEAQPHTDQLNFGSYTAGGPGSDPVLRTGEVVREEGFNVDRRQPLVTGPPGNAAAVYWIHFFEACWRQGLGCGVLPAAGELPASLRVAFAANAHVVDAARAARLAAFVQRGGALLLGPRSGYKTLENALQEGPQPGPLGALVGATVREFDTAEPGDPVLLAFEGALAGTPALHVGVWLEVWEPHEGPRAPKCPAPSPPPPRRRRRARQVLARYVCPGARRRHLHGKAAIVSRRVGAGRVVALGCFGGAALHAALLPLLGLPAAAPLPHGVEAARRGDLLFLLNHTPEPVPALPLDSLPGLPPAAAAAARTLAADGYSAQLAAEDDMPGCGTALREGRATLGPYGYLVLQLAPSP